MKNNIYNENISIPQVLEQIYIAHNYLNKILFGGVLNKIQITIASFGNRNKRKKVTLGHFDSVKHWADNTNEIVLHGIAFNGDCNHILQILTHEMVHQYCFENNIKDTETNGRHNKNFKNEAIRFGMTVEKPISKNSGYTTSINSYLEKVYQELPIDHNIITNFINQNSFKAINTIKKEGLVRGYKYNCKKCSLNFRSKNDMNLICKDCGSDFLKSVY
ncbi:hypothetical protein SSABA_v1c04790 [Spiroplasma sabaudiense Ar-1343]|uniref:SprT-like domain-containing protein n=1 Tax=Spiroplasma sabaudiense Ar-1343 TaxID=1276257 RepID=W6AA53_9MOLU|nr:hypothetical protein [Spiroplasma sabaudiense]AHI53886.1 hypothetical protein SSABA_v1c04790 [Spiroplasma sabaudiense Ar-1343]